MSNKAITVRNVYNLLNNVNLSVKEIKEILDNDASKVLKKWIESNYTDFSVYQMPEYISDLYSCFNCSSSLSVNGTLKYFKKNNIDFKDMTFFDDYNGFGLTTLCLLKDDIKNVFYFNDNPEQVEVFNKLSKVYELPVLPAITDRKNIDIYDVYMSFEVIEHIKEPLEYIKEVDRHIKPGGYLIYSCGFNGTDTMYVGHFTEYIVDGKVLSPKNTSKLIYKWIKERYDYVYKGFNNNPQIFKKKELL